MAKKVVGVLLAGGVGNRMGSKVPKQFLKVAKKPIIIHSLSILEKNKNISGIVVVCAKSHIKTLEKLINKEKFKKVVKIVPGGRTRQGSSFIGLKNCPPKTNYVVIHDAARPFIGSKIIKRILAAAIKHGAATLAVSASDTIVEEKNSFIKSIPNRSVLRNVQTPQAFKYSKIINAHKNAVKKRIKKATDDSALIIAGGGRVKLVAGEKWNIKVTEKIDLSLAEEINKTIKR